MCVRTDAHVHKNIVFMFAFSGYFKKKKKRKKKLSLVKRLSDLRLKILKLGTFENLNDLIDPYV